MLGWSDLTNDAVFHQYEERAFERVRSLCATGTNVFPSAAEDSSWEGTQALAYKALKLTPLPTVKVVILGQDPYHGRGQANGLAFSVPAGIALPPSLRNIFKELQADVGGDLRTNGDLSDWARQGVLLLNSALTVVEGQPNSMADVWEPVTNEIIRFIDNHVTSVVFVLWGNNARKKKALIHHNASFVIESAHPSPLSASRGFFGSKPFSRINDFLASIGRTPIAWV